MIRPKQNPLDNNVAQRFTVATEKEMRYYEGKPNTKVKSFINRQKELCWIVTVYKS